MRRAFVTKALFLVLALAALALPTAARHATWALLAVTATILLFGPIVHPRWGFYVPTRGRGRGRGVALTFDDGPDPRWTPAILAVLRERRVKAAFFVVGRRAEAHPDLVRAMVAEGHVVGGHSFDHDGGFHFRSPRKLTAELARFDRVLAPLLGGQSCRFFRAPQGLRTPMLADALRRHGLVCVGWSARAFDALPAGPDTLLRRWLRGARPGAIVLLHDGGGLGGSDDRSATVAALPRLLDALEARGLPPERLDHLLCEAAYRPLAGTTPATLRVLEAPAAPPSP